MFGNRRVSARCLAKFGSARWSHVWWTWLKEDFEGLRRGDSLLIGMRGCYTNSDLKRARELEESQEARPYPLDIKILGPQLGIAKGNQSWILNIHWKDWCWSWSSNTLATWCEELTHWKRPWCWERLKAGGEGDNRGWDGWMASLTRWTWVWASSGSWWWTGRPGVLQSIGSQLRNWTELGIALKSQVLNICYVLDPWRSY